ncbi:MAG: 6-carboxytetrahydropterin synthase [Burkholderiales bacterium]|nr:6-carboxytetrahydropterin synthase [Burkholderiales bacterium]
MKPPFVLTLASAGFEAARRLEGLPAGHRSRHLHGHGFEATVFAELPPGFAAYPGGEVDALRERLEAALAPLDHGTLNQLIEEPGDAQLARWIRRQLGLPGIERVALRSNAGRGVDLDRDARAQVWRRYRFQAAHRLPHVPLGHKCGRLHGHGFEAVVHARLGPGDASAEAGYDRLDDAWAPLHMALNYRCLNEIEGLDNPTSENLSAWIWRRLQPSLPGVAGVTVFETGSCGAHFDGNHYRIWKEFTLDSAVRLAHAPEGSARRRLHGHTYRLRLQLEAPLDALLGWAQDFGDVKTLFDPIFKSIDHQPLHELPGLADGDAASLACWILARAQPLLPALARVDLHETPGTGCQAARTNDGPAMPV